MMDVLVAPMAWRSLDDLIATRSLPGSARPRVVAVIESLRVLPERGRPLRDRWDRFRGVLGPWPWMLIVYRVERQPDQIAVAAILDVRFAVEGGER